MILDEAYGGTIITRGQGTPEDVVAAIYEASVKYIAANSDEWKKAIVEMGVGDRDSFMEGVKLAVAMVMTAVAAGKLNIKSDMTS